MVYGGESLRKIHNNLPDPSSGDVFVKAKTKLTKYFSPKKNIDYLIYQFREIVQGDNEPSLTFVNRLREVAKHCEFPNMDKEVKRQIIQKTSNRKVRQKALEKELAYEVSNRKFHRKGTDTRRMKTLIVRDVEKVMGLRNVQPGKRPAQIVVR